MLGMGEKKNETKNSLFGYPPTPLLRYGVQLFSGVRERRKQVGGWYNGKKEKAGSDAVRAGKMNLF